MCTYTCNAHVYACVLHVQTCVYIYMYVCHLFTPVQVTHMYTHMRGTRMHKTPGLQMLYYCVIISVAKGWAMYSVYCLDEPRKP